MLHYQGLQPISVEKKKDHLELLIFISPIFHIYYKSLQRKDDLVTLVLTKMKYHKIKVIWLYDMGNSSKKAV
jgi:hypothetical protein